MNPNLKQILAVIMGILMMVPLLAVAQTTVLSDIGNGATAINDSSPISNIDTNDSELILTFENNRHINLNINSFVGIGFRIGPSDANIPIPTGSALLQDMDGTTLGVTTWDFSGTSGVSSLKLFDITSSVEFIHQITFQNVFDPGAPANLDINFIEYLRVGAGDWVMAPAPQSIYLALGLLFSLIVLWRRRISSNS